MQDTFAGEAGEGGGGKEKATGGYFYTATSTAQARNFLAFEFVSQTTHMGIRN